MNDIDPKFVLLNQIERALEAHTKYNEIWATELVKDGLNPEEIMFYKDRSGKAQWLDNLAIRSQLLLALAIERQNMQPKMSHSQHVVALEVEVDRLKHLLARLGFCYTCGNSMPCMNCGAGL